MVGRHVTSFRVPKSKEEFEAHPTAKLAALVTILKYHLEEDRRVPLMSQFNERAADIKSLPPFEEANKLVPDTSFDWGNHYSGDAPEKIIVFSAFPLNNEVICPVSPYLSQHSVALIIFQLLDFNGISVELLNGHQPEPMRTAAIHRFKDAKRDQARVLLMSSVGIQGLNLTDAHIVVFLVSAMKSILPKLLTKYNLHLPGYALVCPGGQPDDRSRVPKGAAAASHRLSPHRPRHVGRLPQLPCIQQGVDAPGVHQCAHQRPCVLSFGFAVVVIHLAKYASRAHFPGRGCQARCPRRDREHRR